MIPIVANVTYGNVGGISKDLVKEVLKELFLEEPDIFNNALKGAITEILERIDYIQLEQAKDRSRIADLELFLGFDEEIQDPNHPYYQEKKERLDKLKERNNFLQSCQTPNGKEDDVLYKELKLRGSMKTRDVMNYLGLKHYQQARRIMEKLSCTHKDVVLDPNEQRKGYRIRVSRFH